MAEQSIPTTSGRRPGRHSRIYWRDTVQGYLFIMPVVLGLILFVFGPMIVSLYISFTEYTILQPPTFIGLRNYVDMFSRPTLRVLQSLGVTIIYAAASVPLTLAAALGAAVLLNQKLPGMRVFRTILYIPTVVPLVATVFVWGWLLHPQLGLINATLEAIGLSPGTWHIADMSRCPTYGPLSAPKRT